MSVDNFESPEVPYEDLGKAAYEAYKRSGEHPSWPEWSELEHNVRNAWKMASNAVLIEVLLQKPDAIERQIEAVRRFTNV